MTDDLENPTCSFCGIQKDRDNPLIAGNNGHICEACVQLCHQVVSSWGRKKQCSSMIAHLRTPKEIKEHLDSYVIGQNEAKETMSVAIYNHYLRLVNQSNSDLVLDTEGEGATELEKSNVILTGPSGTGKTLLVKSLAKVIGVPIVIADATTLTQAGYVGDDVDSILHRLMDAADGDVERAQWGIVYIDEIDKLARAGAGAAAVRDVSGEGVQQSLLKMVEGSEVKLSKGDKRRGTSEDFLLDTTNILFIVGGAFPALEGIIRSRVEQKNKGIGFQASYTDESTAKTSNEIFSLCLPEDLQQFGIIPEFIGRFPVMTYLEELDIDTLLRILKEPKNALVKQYQQLFKYQGVNLEFTEAALIKISQKALDRGTGARGLRGIMEGVLRKTMFDLPSKKNVGTCIVDEQTVNDAGEFIVSEILGTNLDENDEMSSVGSSDVDSELDDDYEQKKSLSGS